MTRKWKERKGEWFHGGYVWVYELLEEYYLWEVEPMCDSFNKNIRSTGEWAITVKRSYLDFGGKHVSTCAEPYVKAEGLSKEVAMELYDKIMTNKYRLPEIKTFVLDAEYTAEAMRLIP